MGPSVVYRKCNILATVSAYFAFPKLLSIHSQSTTKWVVDNCFKHPMEQEKEENIYYRCLLKRKDDIKQKANIQRISYKVLNPN